jgi:hypothetical protein
MRRGGADFTQTMRDHYQTLRRREHERLADRVLRTVGVRQHGGGRVVFVADATRHERALVALAGWVKAWYTSEERHQLYHNNARLGGGNGGKLARAGDDDERDG